MLVVVISAISHSILTYRGTIGFFLLLLLGAKSFGQQPCFPGVSSETLDVNQINATVRIADLWWNGTQSRYEYPKGAGTHALFFGALWISGIDEDGKLRLAAQNSAPGHDFYPGPINALGQTSNSACNFFDRHWKISKSEVVEHVKLLQLHHYQLEHWQVSDVINEWPAKGNEHYLYEGFPIENDLAPFHDFNSNGSYEPAKGDYPLIKGDQSIFWVFNDVGNEHLSSEGEEMGIEVQVMAYAFFQSGDLGKTTFYDCKVINKSDRNYDNCYFSLQAAATLGCWNDNFLGCDTGTNMVFIYNGNPVDSSCGTLGYLDDPPMVGLQFLKTPDVADDQEAGLTAFARLTSANMGHPTEPEQYRRYQTGNWRDGSPIEFGGDGYAEGTSPFPFLYSANPSDPLGWSECSIGVPASSRAFVMSTGPAEWAVGGQLEYAVGVVIRETENYSVCPDTDTTIVKSGKVIQYYFDQMSYFQPDTTTTGIDHPEMEAFRLFKSWIHDGFLMVRVDDPRIGYEVSLFNANGQACLQGAQLYSGINSFAIHDLSAGLYLVRVGQRSSSARTMDWKVVKGK